VCHAASKPATAPAKFKIQHIPFDQYGSNLEEETLFASEPILQPEAISVTIILNKDSAPDSDAWIHKFSSAPRFQ
jgi:hypothetical protein